MYYIIAEELTLPFRLILPEVRNIGAKRVILIENTTRRSYIYFFRLITNNTKSIFI